VSDADISKQALELMNNRQQTRLRKHPVIGERLKMKPIENFDRAIFLAAPHRGTDYADRWFTLAARKIIKLPATFLTTLADTLTSDDVDLKDFVKTLTNDVIQNGPSDLSKKSKFMELTASIPPEKGLVFHSIMGNITKSDDPNVITDAVYGKPIVLQKFGGTPENPGGLKETWIDCGSFIVRRNNQTGSEEIINNNYGTSKLLRRDNHVIVDMNGFPDIHKIACTAYNEYIKSRGVTTLDNYDTNILSILNRRNSLGFYRNRDGKITCYYRLPNFTSSYSNFDIVTGSRLNSYYIVTTPARLTYECSMNIIITDDFEKHLSEIIIDTVLKNGRLTPLVQLFELALSEI
jgi:hypothetical protein